MDKLKPEHSEMEVWDTEQVRQFLRVVQGHRLEALFHLAVVTRLRQGELLGLLQSDPDWGTGRLSIRLQLQGGQPAETKTSAGKRLVVLGAVALERLRIRQEHQTRERLQAGERWHEHNLVFSSRKGVPTDPRSLRATLKRLIRQADLPDIRFRDLRHAATTLMLQQGVHPKLVQERLGRSSILITFNRYSHVLPSFREDVAAQMDDLPRLQENCSKAIVAYGFVCTYL